MKVASIDIPFFKGEDPKGQHAAAVEQLNARIEKHGLDVMNVETIFERGFLGLGMRQIGLRVWVRVESGGSHEQS